MPLSHMRRCSTRQSLAALALTAAVLSCAGEPTGPPPLLTALPRPLTADETTLQTASNSFSFRLLAQLSEAETNRNLFLSPLSVSFALAMANNGAEGETQHQISDVLELNSVTESAANAAYQGLTKLLRELDPTVSMEVANSLWHNQFFSVRSNFSDALTTYFDAGVFPRDFGASATVADINSWVNDQTHGKIASIIDAISPGEIMFLINAIYFRGKWRSPFDPDRSHAGTFEPGDGRHLQATFMSKESDSIEFVHDESLVGVNLPYGNGAFAMALLRPNNTQSINTFSEGLTLQQWNSIRERFHHGKAMLTMPRFKLDYKRELSPELKALGMVRPFDPDFAQFPRIPITPSQLYISRVQHRAAVDVDEVGTTAAAATAVGVGITSAPPQLTFDRPFVFVIYEQITGTILFVGKVVELP